MQKNNKQPIPFLRRFREAGIAAFLLLVVIAASVAAPRFLLPENLRNILLDAPLNIVVAMGMTAVIISRNIDLSVGSLLGLCAMAAGLLMKARPDLPIGLGAALAVALGLLLGAINGGLVAYCRVPAIIATLATLSIYRGLVFWMSGGRQIDPNDVPPALIRFGQTSPIGVPYIVLLAFAVAIGAHLFLRYQRAGREIYAVGNNPKAAKLRGIPVKRTVFRVFVLTGALSGLAGVMYAARYGFVSPGKTGSAFELEVIAATVIGGTNVYGGAGSVAGTLLGCLLLAVIKNALIVTGLSATWQLAAYGAILLIAVLTDALARNRAERTEVSP